MKQGFRRSVTAFLLVCLVVGSIPAQIVFAENITKDTVAGMEELSEAEPSEDETADEFEQAAGIEETEESVSNMQVLDINEDAESTNNLQNDADTDDLPEEDEKIPVETECQINHIVIVSPYLETPGTEEIMVSYGDGSEPVSEAFLCVEDENGGISDWEMSEQYQELYLFSRTFTDENDSGVYQIVSLNLTDETGEHTFLLGDYGMDARFGVNCEYNGYEELQPIGEESDEAVSDESVTATIVSLDSTEDIEAATDQITEALDHAENEIQADSGESFVDKAISTFSAITTYSSSSDIVVALDPGHDSTHAGATSADKKLKEEDLTLKIANYCKEELENYSGVSVYMTRTTAACPYPKTSSSGDDISERVSAAVKAGASIFVSFHLNDASSTSAKGAEVIIQNSNWRPELAAESKALAEAILEELANVGVSMRSNKIYSKDSTERTYSDGSAADYYAVHSSTKKNNIPGIIIEHAFLSNTDDVNNFLSTEEGLKTLGVADATGIASYLGLSKFATPALKSATASSSGIKITWGSVANASGYRVYRKPSGGSWAAIGNTTSTSYTDTSGLEIGATYYYTVRAYKGDYSTALANTYDADYWSDFESPGVSAKAVGVLSTPSLKSATASVGSIKVTWNSVSNASGYRVYRKPSGGSWAAIGYTTGTSYTDSSSLTTGTTYYYTVRAYKGDYSTAVANAHYSNYWSDFDSKGVSAVALANIATPELSKASASSGSITVSWKSASGADGYRVYRKVKNGSWAAIGNTTSLSYQDSSKLEIGTTYYYTVRGYKGDYSTALANTYDSKYWSDFVSAGVSAKAEGVVSTPSLKSATASAESIKVSWGSVSNASGYRVYRKPSGGSWAAIGYTTGTSYTDSSKLEVGSTYYYTVRAYKGDYSTALSNAHYSNYWSDFDSKGVSAKATGVVSTPSLKSATASTGSIQVSWGSVSNASGYRVYRKPSGGSWAAIGYTTGTSYTDSSKLEIGTTYYYTVRAYKGDYSTALSNAHYSNYWSDFDSKGVSAKATGVVSTPSLKSATASAGSIKVSWGSVSNASGYRVYRKPSGGSWAAIGYTTGTSYTDSSKLEIGTTYYYTVRAYKGDYSTALSNAHYSNYWSDFDSKGVSAKATGVLSTPVLKSATASVGSIKITWGSVSGVSGYRVYRKPSGGSWAAIGYTTNTSYTDSNNLSAGTTYYYTVRAYKGDYSTAVANAHYSNYWSDFDSKGISAKAVAVLSTPTLSGTTVVNDGIKVSWKSVSDASGYRVYRKTSGGSWSAIGTSTATSYTDTNGGSSGTTYYYTVRAYIGDYSTAIANTYDTAYWSGFDSAGVSGSAYEIAGTTTTTKAKMVALFNNSGKKYPSSELSKGGASTIDELAQIYLDEAAAEGIKAEVAWCQMILETGYLQYGGQVSVGQFNFAGIGATDGGAAGASFSSCQEGVRAQIQHLKAYATTSALKNTCVDPRFNLVSRGCAKYVEILGQQENPTGNGWATGAGYGQDIVNLIKKL